MSKLQDRVKFYNEFIERENELIWKDFLEELQEIFKANPHITAFSTPAYAPYFSDGDTPVWSFCTYLSKMKTNIVKEDEEIEDDDDKFYDNIQKFKNLDDGKYERYVPDEYKPLEQYVKLASLLPDDVIKSKGSDGQIVFYSDGTVKIEEYYHD